MMLMLAFLAVGASTSPVKAFEQGDIAQALQLAQVRLSLPNLPQESADTARLVEAFALLRQGKMVPAQASLNALAATGLPLGPALDALRVRAASDSLDCIGASHAADNLPPASVYCAPSWAAVTRCALRQRDGALATHAFAQLERAAATSGILADSVGLRARVEALADSPVPRFDRSDRTFLAQPTSLNAVELDITNQAYGAAQMRLNALVPHLTNAGRLTQALYLRGDIAARRGRYREALAAYAQAMEEGPAQPFAWVAAMAATHVAYDQQLFELSQRCARWILDQAPIDLAVTYVRDDGTRGSTSTSALRDEALWMLAWQAYRGGETEEAVDSYLAGIDPDGEYGLAALYWRARVASDLGDNEGAAIFAQLVTQHGPATFYGLLAVELIHRVSPKDSLTLPLVLFPDVRGDAALALGPPAEPSDLKLALVLYEHGLLTEARRTLRRLPMPALSTADRMVAAYLYRQYGEVATAALLSRRAVQTQPIEATLMELAYPRPYDPWVQQAAEAAGVPAALIYAVMREESYFDPHATSARHAMGLMQMLVPTAQSVARSARLGPVHAHALYNPRVAIRLGAFYLAQLLRQNHGDLVGAVAAYQAGARAVARWHPLHDPRPPEVFVEDIPYSSTRNYVKKVLASYAIYRLHEGEAPSRAVQVFDLPGAPLTTASVDLPWKNRRGASRKR